MESLGSLNSSRGVHSTKNRDDKEQNTVTNGEGAGGGLGSLLRSWGHEFGSALLSKRHAVAEDVEAQADEEEGDKVLGVVLEAASDTAALPGRKRGSRESRGEEGG